MLLSPVGWKKLRSNWDIFIPIQDGPFRSCLRKKGGGGGGGGGEKKVTPPNICHTYPTKSYKNDADIIIFSTEAFLK